MITWSLDSLLCQVFQKGKAKDAKLPVYVTSLRLTGSDDAGGAEGGAGKAQIPKGTLISIHPFI